MVAFNNALALAAKSTSLFKRLKLEKPSEKSLPRPGKVGQNKCLFLIFEKKSTNRTFSPCEPYVIPM